MELKDFNFELPQGLIAQKPLHYRDNARLMIIDRKTGNISHDIFRNLDKHLPDNSCLVFNESKVIPARLLGKREKSGGNVEIFLLKELEGGYVFKVLMRPLKRLKLGEKIYFDKGRIVVEIVDKEDPKVRFNKKNVLKYLEKIGHIPLPPYIKRHSTAEDRKYYQTIYAKNSGSVAAPTAGLHFTNRLLNKINNNGHKIKKVTLHVNYGTFKPVEEKNIVNHKMHFEDYFVDQKTNASIIKAKKDGLKIVSVGTTSTRVLETVAKTNKLNGDTDIFIYPGYKFQMVDCLITNFHLPRSTLLMLVHAFGGSELMKNAYRLAIKEKYRFYSYGDGMIIV